MPNAMRCRRSTSRSVLSRKRAMASPSISRAASGCPIRRRVLTPSQRAKAGLRPRIRPSASAQATGVLSASVVGSKGMRDGAGDDIAPV